MSHVEYVTLHNKINKNRSCANRNGRAMETYANMFLYYSEEIPNFQIIVYHLQAATASRTHVLLLAVIFVPFFT